MNDILIRQIYTGTKEYETELKLRDDILRRPLGLCLLDENLSVETEDIHIGAFDANELVGVLILTRSEENSLKMRQVAVKAERQKQGIGTLLVDDAEQKAAKMGFSAINLHARKTAVQFYKRLGYKPTGEEFSEIGIPHRAMTKTIKITKGQGIDDEG